MILRPNILSDNIKKQREDFVAEYVAMFPDIDAAKALALIKSNEHFHFLTEKWYDLLLNHSLEEAYEVYNDDYYFTDMWNCYQTYSRSYLRNMYELKVNNNTQSIIEYFGDIRTVVDIGCGCGITTTALTKMFPSAKIWGINLKGTKQWKFCEQRAQQNNFSMVENIDDISDPIDFIFASEYFEHILDPVTHIRDIVSKHSPKYFVIANAFNTHSIGHFNTYQVEGVGPVDQSKISRMFLRELKQLGYSKVKTSLFNGRPAVYELAAHNLKDFYNE